MKKTLLAISFLLFCSVTANAQFGKNFKLNTQKLQEAGKKAIEAMTLTDAQMAEYTQEYIDWSDANNVICTAKDKNKESKAIAQRLEKIVAGIPATEKSKYDIKAYYVADRNAFACANGSIRIFAGLMKEMTDDQILGIVGHEMGHIVNTDTKDAFKRALLTSALKDAVASTDKNVEKLTDSQLGQLGESFSKASFSQKQEYAADDYGYELLKYCARDPQAMASSLRIIQSWQDEAGGTTDAINQLFSTHPESGKRASKLEEKFSKDNVKPATAVATKTTAKSTGKSTAKSTSKSTDKTSNAWKF